MEKNFLFHISGEKKALKRFFLLFIFFNCLLFLKAPVRAIGTQGVLSGRVTDKDTGKGVDHVLVTAKNPSDTYTATTDTNGYFSMAGLPAGNYTVSLERAGYATEYYGATYGSEILVTGDATTNLQFTLATQAVEVPGITVTAARAPLVSPHQTMTNYGYSNQEIKTVFPGAGAAGGAQSNTILPIYESFPGVQIGYDAYYGAASPHIRGGTGSDVSYAFDGVPTYEPISNTYGTNLTYLGTSRTDFYVGGYPAQYGNFLSGFINQVAGRGSGDPHGFIEYQTGFWTDYAAQLPSAQPYNQASYIGAGPASPANINVELQGKDRRFSYYFNQLAQSDGFVSYAQGVDIKPFIYETNGGIGAGQQTRDSVLNLHYTLDSSNDLQFLFYEGIQKLLFAGFQELPCNPTNESGCSGTTSATGFGETYNAYAIAQLPDMYQISNYDLEKLEWTHRFDAPGEVLNVRAWHYSPTIFFDYFSNPSNAGWQFRRSAENGALFEFQDQLTPNHLIDTGASYLYSNNYLLSGNANIGAPNAPGAYFAGGNLYTYSPTAASLVNQLNIQAVPDTRTIAAWMSDEWRPTPKWDIYAGLRFDQQQFMIIPGRNGNPVTTSVVGYTSAGSPFNLALAHPSLLSPRVGASYQLSDKLTMKASYGKFVTFAPARRVERITAAAGANGPSGTAETQSGNQSQYGESLDVSWEYQFDNDTYGKLTPYVKHIVNPLESYTAGGVTSFINGGVIASQGIELLLKRRVSDQLGGWLSYTYSSTKGSQLPFQTALESGSPGSGPAPFGTGQWLYDQNQMVPVPYDQRHVLSLNVNYKIGKWEFAPSMTYGSGFPYGIGLHNLQALAAYQDPLSSVYGGPHTLAQSITAAGFTNPLGETNFDSLRQPGWWLGNMAVTYHFSKDLDATLNVYNIFNSSQVLQIDNTLIAGVGYAELTNPNINSSGANPAGTTTSGAPIVGCCYTSQDGTQNINPQYNPLKGQYAPYGYANLRQFFLTLHFKY